MRMNVSRFAAALLAAGLLPPFAAGALAQSPPTSTAAPGPNAAVSDQQINEAAAAMQKVMSLRQDYGQRLAQAKPEDRPRIAQEGESKIRQAVADQGLSVDQYNAILQEAQNDPNVRARLLSRVGQPGGAPPASPSNPASPPHP